MQKYGQEGNNQFDFQSLFSLDFVFIYGHVLIYLLGESSNKSLFELSVPVGDKCIDDGLIFIECD